MKNVVKKGLAVLLLASFAVSTAALAKSTHHHHKHPPAKHVKHEAH
ncbi:hypothetical protein AWB81_00457 [Caballeronia arationis]|jgi:hypothetical protein|uniref:Uncharacterized protein n=2 Tax=Caballeronia arationis TaxID=1777142 RepID=A0A7Z7I3C3_9BURK|nr:hypothetical protein AWB81_00457 [Caballeronia arationis]SOE58448.1 hypothetical protein SAMN05446927_1597 [Caballeronia arationis]